MMWLTGKFATICLVMLEVIKVTGKTEAKNYFGECPLRINNHNRPLSPRSQHNGIRGGDLAAEGQFTYVVSLQYGDFSFCGGGIIHNQFVVTAAHCFIDLQNGDFILKQATVLANAIDLRSKKISAIRNKVIKAYVPTAFQPQNIDEDTDDRLVADIAILKLETPFNLDKSAFLSKLSLPDKLNDYTCRDATIVGYGWDKVETYTNPRTKEVHEVGRSSGKLRYAVAQVISNSECREKMGTIHESNICAKVKQRKQDYGEGACAGDSGGPLAYDGTLIGVLSTSPMGCTENEGSGVYTKVASYLDFINAALKDNHTEDMRSHTY